MDNKLKMNLQMFGTDPVNPVEPPQEPVEPTEPKEPKEPKEPEETFTKAEVEEMMAQRVAREKKSAEKKAEEAVRLAKMNDEERAEAELKILQEELAELKQKDAYYGLSREASKMLTEQGIQADDDLLQLVVKEDADATKASVNAFVELVNAKVEQGVKKVLSGSAPRVGTVGNKALTKESILEIKDAKTRVQAIQDNPQLFN